MFHASQAVLALSRDENPTVYQKTLGINDFYFGSPDHDYPLGNIQMIGKSQPEMFRGEKPGETSARSRVVARRGRAPRDRLLALDRGPAEPREPGYRRRRRPATLAYKATNDVPKQELYGKLKSILGKLDMNPAI